MDPPASSADPDLAVRGQTLRSAKSMADLGSLVEYLDTGCASRAWRTGRRAQAPFVRPLATPWPWWCCLRYPGFQSTRRNGWSGGSVIAVKRARPGQSGRSRVGSSGRLRRRRHQVVLRENGSGCTQLRASRRRIVEALDCRAKRFEFDDIEETAKARPLLRAACGAPRSSRLSKLDRGAGASARRAVTRALRPQVQAKAEAGGPGRRAGSRSVSASGRWAGRPPGSGWWHPPPITSRQLKR